MEGTVMKIPRITATVNRGFISAGKKRRCLRTIPGKKKEFYSSYIAKILKQVHQDFSGYSWALAILWSLDNWLFEKAILEAVRLSFFNHRQVVTVREMIAALKQVFPEEWTMRPLL
ncbi:histone H2B-like [Trichosurus vulpecula]|uniref:histone H2B-like n=1 Tax=Trichosurus vulpecula TaxID=9337 RepID=UPI00186B4E34|nr:histone H2B-like [Trichosurus vulpecula]